MLADNDGSFNDLKKLIAHTWPYADLPEEFKAGGVYGSWSSSIKGQTKWERYSESFFNLPTQSVKIFLEEIEQEEPKNHYHPITNSGGIQV